MDIIPCFDAPHLEAACKVLADTTMGLKGDEIGYILEGMCIADPDPATTKWKRLFNALVLTQNKHQVGNHLIMFIIRAMKPVRYVNAQEQFILAARRLNLNYGVFRPLHPGRWQCHPCHARTSLARAKARGKLKAILEARGTHPEVFKYCRAELLEENYFHAVFEAAKGLAQRIRDLSGLTTDGGELIAEAFSVKSPIVTFNSLQTETERSDQKGIANLMTGLFGAI